MGYFVNLAHSIGPYSEGYYPGNEFETKEEAQEAANAYEAEGIQVAIWTWEGDEPVYVQTEEEENEEMELFDSCFGDYEGS